jgi:hypothetical protein
MIFDVEYEVHGWVGSQTVEADTFGWSDDAVVFYTNNERVAAFNTKVIISVIGVVENETEEPSLQR